MGCSGSRLDKRRDFAKSNYAVVPYNFLLAYEENIESFCPQDIIDRSATKSSDTWPPKLRDYSECYGEIKEFKLAEVNDTIKG